LKAIFFFQGNSRQAIDDKADRFVVTSRSKNSEASARRKLAIVAACCLRFRRLVASAASSLPPPRRFRRLVAAHQRPCRNDSYQLSVSISSMQFDRRHGDKRQPMDFDREYSVNRASLTVWKCEDGFTCRTGFRTLVAV